jgi:hypothetical protein
MSKPVTPGWPESGVFPFMPFPSPSPTLDATADAPAGAAPPLMQGLTGGIDLMKDFWSHLPGSAPLPGFMVPTVDLEELDKRIGDLKAAQSWVEINLNLLRTTIQGLEVQRHTIAAIRSLTPPAGKPAADSSSEAPPDASAAAAHWLGYLQDQFAKVAQAAAKTNIVSTKPAARDPAGRKSAARKKKPKPSVNAPRKAATPG